MQKPLLVAEAMMKEAPLGRNAEAMMKDVPHYGHSTLESSIYHQAHEPDSRANAYPLLID